VYSHWSSAFSNVFLLSVDRRCVFRLLANPEACGISSCICCHPHCIISHWCKRGVCLCVDAELVNDAAVVEDFFSPQSFAIGSWDRGRSVCGWLPCTWCTVPVDTVTLDVSSVFTNCGGTVFGRSVRRNSINPAHVGWIVSCVSLNVALFLRHFWVVISGLLYRCGGMWW